MIDRHHLLHLFEQLHEKYNITDGEYKEFVEALAGKKSTLKSLDNVETIKVVFDMIECQVEYVDDDVLPTTSTHMACSRIWKIIPNVNNYHACGNISNDYMHGHELHKSVAERFLNDDKYITMAIDPETHRRISLKIISVDII